MSVHHFALGLVLADYPRPWRAEASLDGLHALVDANDGLVARAPDLLLLRTLADLINALEEKA